MIALAWEAGHTVLVAVGLWLVAGALLVGMACAAVAQGALWVWRRISRRTATGPRRALDGRLTAELRSEDPRVTGTGERRSEPRP